MQLRNLSLPALALVVCTLFLFTDAVAQQVLVDAQWIPAPAQGEMDPGDEEQLMRQSILAIYQQNAEARIKELDRVCELSDSQRRKLEVASMGAVEDLTDEELEHQKEMRGQWGLPMEFQFAPNVAVAPAVPLAPAVAVAPAVEEAPPEEAPPEEARPEEAPPEEAPPVDAQSDVVDLAIGPEPVFPAFAPVDAPFAIAPQVNGFVIQANNFSGFGMNSQRDISTNRIWYNAVDKVLTDEQKSVYEEHLAGRERFKRETMVRELVVTMDEVLFLTHEQREKLFQQIDEKFGQQLVDMETMQIQANGIDALVWEKMEAFGRDVTGMLDEKQVTVWEQHATPLLMSRLGMYNAGLPPSPIIDFNPPALNPGVNFMPELVFPVPVDDDNGE